MIAETLLEQIFGMLRHKVSMIESEELEIIILAQLGADKEDFETYS
jgi:hypothetical protein